LGDGDLFDGVAALDTGLASALVYFQVQLVAAAFAFGKTVVVESVAERGALVFNAVAQDFSDGAAERGGFFFGDLI
jgi:hypothetical protein